MKHTPSTPEQRAQVLTAARDLWRRLQLATEERMWREEREWARLRDAAEDALEDAPTLVMGRREVPEVTVIRRIRRERERTWLDSAERQVTSFERARFARRQS